MVVQQNMAQSKSNPIAQPSRLDLAGQVVEAHLNKTISQKMAPVSKRRARIQT